MGVTIEEPDESEDINMIKVWRSNWPILEVFLALETQWNAIVMGGGMEAPKLIWLGLDYCAVDVVVRRFGFADDDREILANLKDMEIAALAVQDGPE